MGARTLIVPLVLAGSAWLSAQTATPQPPPAAATTAPALPVKRVVLYKTGVGYFEHLGTVRNRQDVTIRFTSAQLNDVLKSLTALDLGKGQIGGISYNSVAPLEQRLGGLRLPLEESTTQRELLASLRGARLEVTSGATAVEGRLLSVEQRSDVHPTGTVTIDTFSIVTDGGELRAFDLTPSVRVRIIERDLRQEIGRYLDLLGSTREQDVRSLTLATNGSGERQIFVSYVSEVPIWKSTYRLVLPAKGQPLLQGWAIVDNTIGEDWQGVSLSLVAGAPQSFIQQISQPYYGHRPVVPMPSNVQMAPQTHQATLERKESSAAMASPVEPPPPPPAPASPAFRSAGGGGGARGGVAGGVVGGVVGGLPEKVMIDGISPMSEAIPQLMRETEAAATGSDLGDLFEYRIKEPVTLRKNQSALVPIVNQEITAEKVSLWTRPAGSGRPLRALWLTNATTLTLDGGSMTIIDGDAFAGEGLIEPIKPAERRLVSYGADQAVLVDARGDGAPRRVLRVRARDGILVQDTEERLTTTYKARNEGTTATVLIVEHRMRQGWKLAEGSTPVESTPDTQRFRLTIDAKKEAQLLVREVRSGASTIRLGDVGTALIAQMTQSGVPAASLQQALQPLLDQQALVAAAERRLQDLQQQRAAIVEDQQRLRENMKALKGSAEEKQLLLRYTKQLDDQETKLEALQRDIAAAAAARDAARARLATLIGTLSFELAGS